MPSKTIPTPARSASRWWRLDPLVAAHLRSDSKPATSLENGVARVKRWNAESDDTQWADTNWSDTVVDFHFD